MPVTLRHPLFHRFALGAFSVAVTAVGVSLIIPADELPPTGLWDKLEHALAFAGLMIFGTLAFPQRRHLVPLALSLMVFGAIGEVAQIFVPGRSASFADALADAVGIALVAGLSWTARSSLVRPPRPSS